MGGGARLLQVDTFTAERYSAQISQISSDVTTGVVLDAAWHSTAADPHDDNITQAINGGNTFCASTVRAATLNPCWALAEAAPHIHAVSMQRGKAQLRTKVTNTPYNEGRQSLWIHQLRGVTPADHHQLDFMVSSQQQLAEALTH
jgi:hypothetical protein